MTDNVSPIADVNKKERDSRSHDQRVSDLQREFLRLKAQAIASGNKSDASAAKVLGAAGVNRSYFYTKNKLKDAVALSKYHSVRDSIQDFQDSFENFSSDSLLNTIKEKLEKSEKQRKGLQEEIIQQQSLIAGLQSNNLSLKKKVRTQSENMIEYQHSAITETKSSFFSEPMLIEPDKYLWRNGQYLYANDKVREKAWSQAKEDLLRALKRPLPMRVYMLVGAPCSGKSTWAKTNNNFFPNLHPVVIDATNLTYVNRLEWVSLINKFRNNVHKLCAVVFLTPTPVLQSRNNRREPTKKLETDNLLRKVNDLEFPNLANEDFDELIVVRGSHE